MNLPISFTLRFQTMLASLPFIAEAECSNVEEVREHFLAVHSQDLEVELVAALIYIELAKPEDKGCYLLDGISEKLYASILDELKLGSEHYLNKTMGSYDRFANRVTPIVLGVTFPDGTLRVVWEEEHAAQDFDTSLEIIKGVVELLLQAQDLAYFQQTEDELENNDFESPSNRRADLLFAAGLWPAEDGTFAPEPAKKVAELLARYKNMTVPKAVAV